MKPSLLKRALLGALLLLVPCALKAMPDQTVTSGPAAEAALTNADVVKLSKLDLGDEVVIAKVNQAKKTEFKLDADSLVALKQQGVSKAVIAAMLKRASAAPAAAAGAQPAPFPGATNPGDGGVLLRAGQKEVRLNSVLGDLSSTWAYVTTLTFLDFPGLKAPTQVQDTKPTLVIHTTKSPRGRVFLVKCESNEKDNNRSVKLGRRGMFTSKAWGSPDSDWTVEFDTKEVAENTWELTPKQALKTGEYGLLFKGGFLGVLDPTRGELFDFGVN